MAAATETPKVPKRNDQKSSPLYRNSRATELRGQDPSFVYQWFSENPESPAYIGNKLAPHEFGEANGYKVMIEGWEECHSQTDRKVRAMDPRTDQGKPVDTLQRHGRQVLCRIPKEEFAKYAECEQANQKEKERQLFQPDALRGQHASMTAIVMDGDQDESARTQALINAGHPIPGVSRGST